jgi:hypothetical protein
MSIVKTWFHDVRNITCAEVFITFSTHVIAKTFIDNFANKCAHYTYRKQLHTAVLAVDLEDEAIELFKTRLSVKPNVPDALFVKSS